MKPPPVNFSRRWLDPTPTETTNVCYLSPLRTSVTQLRLLLTKGRAPVSPFPDDSEATPDFVTADPKAYVRTSDSSPVRFFKILWSASSVGFHFFQVLS